MSNLETKKNVQKSKDLSENFVLLNPLPEHFEQIQELCKKVYPFSKPWSLEQLESHRFYFPDGQLIVIDKKTNQVLGLAFSLIVYWNDYSPQDSWKDFTSGGFFHNHNPKRGKTLYGAEVMVDPQLRGLGIGRMLYEGRKRIVEKYNLKRIRAGARLRGYSKFKDKLTPVQYVKEVVEKKIYDPTLSFQLGHDYKVIDVAPNYLFNDPESLGFAAVIEWLNPKNTTAKDLEMQKQSIDLLMSGEKFVPQFLPKELRRLVRKATHALGQIILEQEGDTFYRRIEFYREQLKKTRKGNSKEQFKFLLAELKNETRQDRLKIAHAFSLQLEVVNACEAAYRSWRQREKPQQLGVRSKLILTYVLTAHPTEARSQVTVENLNNLEKILVTGIYNSFLMDETELSGQMRMLWLYPLSKVKSPSVIDEAEYIYSLIFSPDIFDFIILDKPGYELRLRTWVGGDKDGHPGVNHLVMKQCLRGSRTHILNIISQKLGIISQDLLQLLQVGKSKKSELDAVKSLQLELHKLQFISKGDGTRIKTWCLKFNYFYKKAGVFTKNHIQTVLIRKILEMFPAFVLPIELREDSALIAAALKNKNLAIREMLTELSRISGSLEINCYARGLVISHCESADDITHACQLVEQATKNRKLPVIPLFESKEALVSAKKILKNWFRDENNIHRVYRYWGDKFEVMLGYSDSSKQIGVLPSRLLITKAMDDIEKTLQKLRIKPIFFHGSGGSVARGGGSLKEQISWWSQSAVAHPKMTVQGEMIQRLFASKEILNSQCIHMTNEALRRKVQKIKTVKSTELQTLAKYTEDEYKALVSDSNILTKLLTATPYQYLDVFKIGSRPSKRPEAQISIAALRAIPWVLCWTQSRVLFPTWWGVGTAWKKMTTDEKNKLKTLFTESPFFSSFVKALGFTLAKVELEMWQMYFGENEDVNLFKRFRSEYLDAITFVREMSQKNSLIWHRPWLEESIRLRSPHIHILNLAQILAMEDLDEALLKETIVGIACGMLTTG